MESIDYKDWRTINVLEGIFDIAIGVFSAFTAGQFNLFSLIFIIFGVSISLFGIICFSKPRETPKVNN